jgi:hypothetical protein
VASVIWIEGVDLGETMLDTGKLSVIRGASRGLEQMPHDAQDAVGAAVRPVALGASMAGFVVEGDAAKAVALVAPLLKRLERQMPDPEVVADCVKATSASAVARFAPYAHLKFHHAVVEVKAPGADTEMALAIETARARVRAAQLREPGVRAASTRGITLTPRITSGEEGPCDWDGFRPAEDVVSGPPTPQDEEVGKKSSPYTVSFSTGARWHFGRALRQRLYENAHEKLKAQPLKLAFVDDLQEMIQKETMTHASGIVSLPRLPDGAGLSSMPVSVENKIALLTADGDKFGDVRDALKKDLGTIKGLSAFTAHLETHMRALLTRLVTDLALLRDLPGAAEAEANLRAAASLRVGDAARHVKLRKELGLTESDRLLRLETLLFGGDDTIFAVPAWLGWWLAMTVVEETESWPPVIPGDDRTKLHFSLGLVFAPAKTPIRTLKDLAWELMTEAKATGGGLEIEVLESIEPPAAGLGDLRGKLFGKRWRAANRLRPAETHSRMTISREKVASHFETLANFFGDDPLPVSQLHRALRAGRREGEKPGAGGLAATDALTTANNELKAGQARSERLGAFSLFESSLLPFADDDSEALRLHFLLQQRDYVRAAKPFVDAIREQRNKAKA